MVSTPEERHRIYKMLRLEVMAYPDKTLRVSGALVASAELGDLGLLQTRESQNTQSLKLRFRALVWELSGLMKCSGCGCGMLGNSPTNGSRNKVHHYYRCRTRHLEGKGACSMSKNIRAEEAEHAVWSFVTGLLLNPKALRDGLDEMIRQESAGSHGNPEEETAIWLDRLADVEHKRASFQDMAA
jgi:hypothetical protein